MDYTNLSLLKVIEALNNKEVTSVELTKQCLQRIEDTKKLNALISVNAKQALKEAKHWDHLRSKGQAVPVLAGVPITIKDNINIKGTITTCASKFLKNYISPYTATVAQKLIDNGAIVLGKNNMDEFAMGGSSENSAFGPVFNPHGTNLVPGGSSGGSASSVAVHQCFASVGTDTGGSVRQPASFCGVVGLKPTYGTVSRYGIVAFASSLDQAGPITKTVKDSALMCAIMQSEDERDATSVPRNNKFDYLSNISNSVKGKKIGLVKEFDKDGNNKQVEVEFQKACNFFKENGAEIVEISLPNINNALACYYVLSSAEAASNLSRFDGVRYGVRAADFNGLVDMYFKSRTQGFGTEVKRRIMLGNFVLSSGYFNAYYKQAKRVQQSIIKEFEKAFEKCDVILTPTAPTQAYKVGEKVGDPLTMYLGDMYTVPVNIAELTAISIPAKVSAGELPVGLQFIGAKFSEQTLFDVANFYEQNKGVEK